jgi:multimeric flavodoxin WrbA
MPARPEPLRVIGLSGSPRAGGNTDTLLAACLDGAQAAGGEVETIAVRDLQVAGCLECLRCREGGCPQPDDAPPTLERLSAADLVIIAAPVFFCGVPAQLKALIDRAQPLWLRRLPPEHPRRQWRGGYFISAAASQRPEAFLGASSSVRSFLATLGTTWLGELCAGGLEEAGAAARQPSLLRRSRAGGSRLVRDLRARRRRLRREWLEAEADQLEHAGEIPEVALHGALYALGESPEGPRLVLSAAERRRLERAALERYRRIVLRDLTFRNRRFAIFRGISRAIANFERLSGFARRFRFAAAGFRGQAAEQLEGYLAAEIASGWCCRSLDCSRAELEAFAARLGTSLAPLGAALDELFERPPLHWEETQRLAFMATTKLYPFRFCRRRRRFVEVGVATTEHEAPQTIRLPLSPDKTAALAKARAIWESIPKPDLPASSGLRPALP